jgi:phosphatidylglycerophosphatase A
MNFFDKSIVFAATGFGVGHSKVAPGTLGSLVGIPFAFLLSSSSLSQASKAALLLLLLACFFLITARAEKILATHDDQRIVIDEVAGQMVTLVFFDPTFVNVIFGFFLFRLFDIWKPGPIGYIDERLPGAWGTFFDDIAAGGFACAVLYFIQGSF